MSSQDQRYCVVDLEVTQPRRNLYPQRNDLCGDVVAVERALFDGNVTDRTLVRLVIDVANAILDGETVSFEITLKALVFVATTRVTVEDQLQRRYTTAANVIAERLSARLRTSKDDGTFVDPFRLESVGRRRNTRQITARCLKNVLYQRLLTRGFVEAAGLFI